MANKNPPGYIPLTLHSTGGLDLDYFNSQKPRQGGGQQQQRGGRSGGGQHGGGQNGGGKRRRHGKGGGHHRNDGGPRYSGPRRESAHQGLPQEEPGQEGEDFSESVDAGNEE